MRIRQKGIFADVTWRADSNPPWVEVLWRLLLRTERLSSERKFWAKLERILI